MLTGTIETIIESEGMKMTGEDMTETREKKGVGMMRADIIGDRTKGILDQDHRKEYRLIRNHGLLNHHNLSCLILAHHNSAILETKTQRRRRSRKKDHASFRLES